MDPNLQTVKTGRSNERPLVQSQPWDVQKTVRSPPHRCSTERVEVGVWSLVPSELPRVSISSAEHAGGDGVAIYIIHPRGWRRRRGLRGQAFADMHGDAGRPDPRLCRPIRSCPRKQGSRAVSRTPRYTSIRRYRSENVTSSGSPENSITRLRN